MKMLTENDSSDMEYVQLKLHVMKRNLWSVSFHSSGLFGFILLYLRPWMVR